MEINPLCIADDRNHLRASMYLHVYTNFLGKFNRLSRTGFLNVNATEPMRAVVGSN